MLLDRREAGIGADDHRRLGLIQPHDARARQQGRTGQIDHGAPSGPWCRN